MQVDRVDGPVRHWRYLVPGTTTDWGAVVYLESSGIFLAYSDWGTYGYRWTAPGGDDIREFFAHMPKGRLDYFVSKFAPGRTVLDVEATQAAIQKRVRELRRSKRFSPDETRRELDLAKSFTDEVELAMNWYSKTLLSADDSHDLPVYVHHPQAVAFCEHILPKLAVIIAAELAAERGPVAEATP